MKSRGGESEAVMNGEFPDSLREIEREKEIPLEGRTETVEVGSRSECGRPTPGGADTPLLEKRPRHPGSDARATMVTAEDTAEAITLIAALPQRTHIPELVIRPTFQRDFTGELGTA